jgi:hypothetical protein
MVSNVKPGDWVQGSEKFLDATCIKAAGGGSAIPRGKVVVLDEATGIWDLPGATSGVKGKKGVVTHTNVDADETMTVMHGGGIVYVTVDDAVQADAAVQTSGTVDGNVEAFTVPALYADADRVILGYYRGHADEGDGSSSHPKTETVATDVVKIQLVDSG